MTRFVIRNTVFFFVLLGGSKLVEKMTLNEKVYHEIRYINNMNHWEISPDMHAEHYLTSRSFKNDEYFRAADNYFNY